MTLVIMAAGLGSRFKGGIKQLTKINDKSIMELSIDNAKSVGFNKVVFITRKELKEDFDKYIIPNIDIEYEFVYQSLDDTPIKVDTKRTKPWGTGQALLCLKGVVNENFVIINADDYYNKDAFKKLYNHLKEENGNHATVAYKLKNTFVTSNLGNRGACKIEDSKLTKIEEVYGIKKENDLFTVDGKEINPNTEVSMNIWGFRPNIFELFENKFVDFLNNNNLEKDEFVIPNVINELLNDDFIVNAYTTDDICAGITFMEDVEEFKKIL